MTLTLRALMAELQHELDDITKLRVMCHQYSKMRQHLIPWLKHKPVVTRLVQTRKQLKILKSKLRHTLAAKEDLEEVYSNYIFFCDIYLVYLSHV